MHRSIVLVLLSVVVGIVGQICLKAAVTRIGPLAFDGPSKFISSGLNVFQQPLVWFALPLYGCGFIFWSIALSHLPLSYAYPFMSLAYVLAPLAGFLLFHEQIPMMRWVGGLVLLVGIVFVGLSYKAT